MKVSLPTSWEHVTVATYAAIQGKQGEELLAALLDISLEEAYAIVPEQLEYIWQTISFLNVPIPYEPHTLVNAPVIALEPIGKFERAKWFLLNYPYWDVCPNVYATYYLEGEYSEVAADAYALEVDKLPITEVYTAFRFIDEEMNRFLTRYKTLFDSEYEDTQVAAGISDLEKYGFFLTLHQKCNGDPTRYEQMLKVPADTFYMTLSVEKDLNKYQAEYQRLKNITK